MVRTISELAVRGGGAEAICQGSVLEGGALRRASLGGAKRTSAAPVAEITRSIRVVRGQRVLLDAELAALYGVPTKRLNEQVKRNAARFPEDFMFRLTAAEAQRSRSHFATLKRGQNIKYRPHAFTEHGAIQAANVLNSARAIEMSVYVVRAFVQLRALVSANVELARRLDQLEARVEKKLVTHDEAIAAILSAIRQLMQPPVAKRRGIGFTAEFGDGRSAEGTKGGRSGITAR